MAGKVGPNDTVIARGAGPGLLVTSDAASGDVSFRFNGEGVKDVAVDIYCDDVKRESVEMKRGIDGYFSGGPVAKCRDGAARMKLSAKALMAAPKPANIPDGGYVKHPKPRFPNPRAKLWELPPDKPLEVNTDKKHYFSRRTRGQGEEDLRRLCAVKGTTEEMFLFIEGVDKEGNALSYWYEVGEQDTQTTSTGMIDSFFIGGVKADFAKITGFSDYHFHPKNGANKIGAEYPSPIDYNSLFKSALDAEKIGYPVSLYETRVVTVNGVFIFKPNVGVIIVNQGHIGEFVKGYEEFFEVFIKVQTKVFSDLPESELGRRFAVGASNPLVEMKFKPF